MMTPGQPANPQGTMQGLGMSQSLQGQPQDAMAKKDLENKAQDQVRSLMDMTIYALAGSLPPEEAQQVFALIMKSLGPDEGKKYIQSVKDLLEGAEGGEETGGVRTVAGPPSNEDNVMATTETGEPVKLATGEGIVPTEAVQAAGGMGGLMSAAAQSNPNLRPHAERFMREADI